LLPKMQLSRQSLGYLNTGFPFHVDPVCCPRSSAPPSNAPESCLSPSTVAGKQPPMSLYSLWAGDHSVANTQVVLNVRLSADAIVDHANENGCTALRVLSQRGIQEDYGPGSFKGIQKIHTTPTSPSDLAAMLRRFPKPGCARQPLSKKEVPCFLGPPGYFGAPEAGKSCNVIFSGPPGDFMTITEALELSSHPPLSSASREELLVSPAPDKTPMSPEEFAPTTNASDCNAGSLEAECLQYFASRLLRHLTPTTNEDGVLLQAPCSDACVVAGLDDEKKKQTTKTPRADSSGEPRNPHDLLPDGDCGVHPTTCKPCRFLHLPKGCLNGENCNFCHLKHPPQKRSRCGKLQRIRLGRTIAQLEEIARHNPEALGDKFDKLLPRSATRNHVWTETLRQKLMSSIGGPKGLPTTAFPCCAAKVQRTIDWETTLAYRLAL